MSEDDEAESDDRMGRADRIRSTREGRRSQSRRSRTDQDTNESENQQDKTQSSQTSQRAQTSQQSQRNKNTPTNRPVKDRPHRTIYLPSALDDKLDSHIDRIQYEAKHETEDEKVQLAKNRHLYPLIVHLGLEQVENMTIDEMLATLTDTDTLDMPDR